MKNQSTKEYDTMNNKKNQLVFSPNLNSENNKSAPNGSELIQKGGQHENFKKSTAFRRYDNMKEGKSQPLSQILAQAGAGFVLIRRPGEKIRLRSGEERTATGKEPIGRNWQNRPQTLAAALNHARRGGNVGVLGGHNNIIILDADANADLVEQAEPRLRHTVKIFRPNAPDRAKWIVKVDGPLPKSQKAHGKLEILSAGAQGVVAGQHHSGAKLEYTGQEIVTLTADDIAALWRRVVGEEIEQQAQPASAPADTEAVAKSMGLVEKLIEAGGLRPSAWRDYQDGGRIVTLESCPFVERTSEPQRQHSAPHKAFIFVSPAGQINAGCHAARCQQAIHDHGGSGWALLKEIVGWDSEPKPDFERQRELIAALMQWIRRADLAEYVPIRLQAANGYRTRDTDTAVALAILHIAYKHGRTTKLVLPLRKLREATGIGSLSTVRNALARLSGWFLVQDEAPQNPSHAYTYSIHPSILATASEMVAFNVAQIERDMYVAVDIDINTTSKTTRSIYATYSPTLPLDTHLHRDAFSSVQRPMTEEELQEKIAQREKEIAAGLDVKPIQRSRYRRRLRAALPSLGRTVLRLIDYLAEAGGVASRKDLREALNLSPSALSRAIFRAAELGLVTADRRAAKLHEAWAELVDAFEPYMPTAGRGRDRIMVDLDATIRYINMRLRQKDLPAGEIKRLNRRKERCASRKRKLQMLERPDLPAVNLDIAPPSAYERHAERKLKELHSQAKIAIAEERHADAWRLQKEVRKLRSDGVERQKAWWMLNMAGWSRSEIAAVMNVFWPLQQTGANAQC